MKFFLIQIEIFFEAIKLICAHFPIAWTLLGKLYFREAMVSLFLTSTEGKDYLLFTGAWHFVVQS